MIIDSAILHRCKLGRSFIPNRILVVYVLKFVILVTSLGLISDQEVGYYKLISLMYIVDLEIIEY